MKLTTGKSILLFRFHKDPEQARERIKTLKYFNPGLPIYAMHGGETRYFQEHKKAIEDLVEGVWCYPQPKGKDWKWKHGDLMLKEWYRQAGRKLEFDFLYYYEYDLLIVEPLADAYPDIGDKTLALAACTKFTKKIENNWFWTSAKSAEELEDLDFWTSSETPREKYLKFRKYLEANFGIQRQQKVCLGPGPLVPKKFLEAWSQTEDIDFVHDELAYPAYAQALGFKAADNGLHPGFSSSHSEEKYFNCNDYPVSKELIIEELSKENGRRVFHPVKYVITLEEIDNATGNNT